MRSPNGDGIQQPARHSPIDHKVGSRGILDSGKVLRDQVRGDHAVRSLIFRSVARNVHRRASSVIHIDRVRVSKPHSHNVGCGRVPVYVAVVSRRKHVRPRATPTDVVDGGFYDVVVDVMREAEAAVQVMSVLVARLGAARTRMVID